jgi:hypothetical protein
MRNKFHVGQRRDERGRDKQVSFIAFTEQYQTMRRVVIGWRR